MADPDSRQISISQTTGGDTEEQPHSAGRQFRKERVPADLSAIAIGLRAENQQEITGKITNAQSAQIIKTQKRYAEALVAGADWGVHRDPYARQKKQGVNEMEHLGGKRYAYPARISKIRRPPNSDKKNRNQRWYDEQQRIAEILAGVAVSHSQSCL